MKNVATFPSEGTSGRFPSEQAASLSFLSVFPKSGRPRTRVSLQGGSLTCGDLLSARGFQDETMGIHFHKISRKPAVLVPPPIQAPPYVSSALSTDYKGKPGSVPTSWGRACGLLAFDLCHWFHYVGSLSEMLPGGSAVVKPARAHNRLGTPETVAATPVHQRTP